MALGASEDAVVSEDPEVEDHELGLGHAKKSPRVNRRPGFIWRFDAARGIETISRLYKLLGFDFQRQRSGISAFLERNTCDAGWWVFVYNQSSRLTVG